TGSVSTPPLAVPPLSRTWNVKLDSGEPLALSAGGSEERRVVKSVDVGSWRVVKAMPLLVSVPVPARGNVVISTGSSALAGLSFGSLKPNSAAVNVWAVSSLVVIVLSGPDGASFTEVTLIVLVLATGSVSTPPLAVPPLSRTWNVKLDSGEPLALSAG